MHSQLDLADAPPFTVDSGDANGPTLASTGPIWDRAERGAGYPRLAEELEVDVAVIGGGVTGVTTALLLAEAGRRVVLLEGRHLTAGVTGHTTAHLTEALDTRYHELERSFGLEGARLIRESSRGAIEMIARLSTTAADGAGFRRVPGYLFCEHASGIEELDEEAEAARRAGAQVDRHAVPLSIPTAGGLCFRNQAELDPRRYVESLAERVARSATGRVFTDTQVVDVESSDGLKLHTAHGPSVKARAVVVATHAPFTKATFQLKVSQYRSYAVAAPVAAGADGLFWDTEDPYHYLRSATIAGRSYLIIGGEDHKTGKVPEGGFDAPFARLTEYAARFGAQPTARWSAQVVESVDGLPFIGQPSPSEPIYVATGFSGNGITFGTLAATMITASLLGEPNPYAELYRANRFNPLSSLGPLLTENVDFPAHRLGDALHAAPNAAPDSVEPGQGRILNVRGERLAVYRALDGTVHALSAVCTHMGCQVAFNPTERSWDCPCHGSRFGLDGAVLDGPATKALARREP